ncbi:MAG: RNA polymerase sigma factor [Pseudonocardiaceae bacterium]
MTTTELPTPTATWVSHETDLAELVAGARAGCAASWREIVDRFDDRLQRAARARGLDSPTAADVVQQTWMAALANIKALRTAQALGGWLRSILHRECLKALNLRRRETPHVDETHLTGCINGRTVMMHAEPRSPEEEALRSEQVMLLQMARRRLSRRDQDLLALLVVDPPLPYTEISRRLGIPIGSIGPTRARCFARLRRELAALGVHSGYGASPRPPRPMRRQVHALSVADRAHYG